jgi:hypothetical protein
VRFEGPKPLDRGLGYMDFGMAEKVSE